MKVYIALVLMFAALEAQAYIDPGTGMAFVSGIGAWLAAIGVFFIGAFSLFFKRIAAFFKGLFKKKNK